MVPDGIKMVLNAKGEFMKIKETIIIFTFLLIMVGAFVFWNLFALKSLFVILG